MCRFFALTYFPTTGLERELTRAEIDLQEFKAEEDVEKCKEEIKNIEVEKEKEQMKLSELREEERRMMQNSKAQVTVDLLSKLNCLLILKYTLPTNHIDLFVFFDEQRILRFAEMNLAYYNPSISLWNEFKHLASKQKFKQTCFSHLLTTLAKYLDLEMESSPILFLANLHVFLPQYS